MTDADRIKDLEAQLAICRYALVSTERTLEGGYPWLLRPGTKWTQRQARESCLGIVRRTISLVGRDPRSDKYNGSVV